ncbi:unnamed protein product [Periconia digitata]|uniref:Cytochrome P450 n=1 Tax=Periconia digitata TaxID=1303443 RepID=A0A9W4XGA0_9PLEO|nr:unnamed protein product [Periconia digitata]
MLDLALLSKLLPFLLALHFLYKHTSNPLRLIPAAHPLAPWTSLWISYIRWSGRENRTLKEAHERLGAVVCLGPGEVSVNCVAGGIREIYAGGFEKGIEEGQRGFNWYGFFANYGGVDNMFSMGPNKPHSARKRMISNIYSKSVIITSPALLTQTISILKSRFLPILSSRSAFSKGDDPTVVNIIPILNAATMDIVTAYIFGLKSSSNLLNNPKDLTWFLDLYNSRRSFNFWPQEYPKLTSWIRRWTGYRLVPQWVDAANAEIEKWTMGMCKRAGSLALQQQTYGINVEDSPSVLQQLSSSLLKQSLKDKPAPTADPAANAREMQKMARTLELTTASEVLDHLAAGFDTSSITLTYAVHELSQNQDIQSQLRRELQALTPSSTRLPDPKTLDAAPFLHAVVYETLRLHSAIPGPQPRVTPTHGCKLGSGASEFYVPGGVRVSASAGLLHMNEDVYEQADEWRPERWIDLHKLSEEKRKDMESRWFWAFGSGGRMCVGSHLAIYQMKYILYTLYSTFSTSIVDDTNIEQTDAYTAPPGTDELWIKLERL